MDASSLSLDDSAPPQADLKPHPVALPRPTAPSFQEPPQSQAKVEQMAAHRGLAEMGIVASAPPLAVSSFVASLLEPGIAIATLISLTYLAEETVDVPTRLLAALTLLLLFPGRNRFYEAPAKALLDLVGAWLTVGTVLLLCGYATDTLHQFDPQILTLWAVATPAFQFAATQLGRWVMRGQAEAAGHQYRSLIIGAGPLGAKVGSVLEARRAFGHHVVGYVEDRSASRSDPTAYAQRLGGFDDIPALIRRHKISEVYLTLPLSGQPRLAHLLAELRDSAVSIYFVPDLFAFNVIQGRMRNMDGLPVVSLLESPFVGMNAFIKRLSDIVLASLILVLISPVLLAVAIAVKRSSPGPVIFKQKRHGLDGQEIEVWKFRSMTVTENGADVKQATRNDPRVTKVGAFIRRTSLDELPQFINVLQGQMSVVGPRPHALAHNDHYRQLIGAYMIRHKVKPGITGLAQVSGYRGETEVIEKMSGRVEYDIEYLRKWSLWLDLKIIGRTAGMMFFDRAAF